MAPRLKWRGEQVTAETLEKVSLAMGEFALEVEGNSKRELRRGHGVLTGTARRSIHVAQPGYSWHVDHTEPSAGTPELGGKTFAATIDGKRVTIQVGSGLNYALPLHQGHGSFGGYHYMTNGLNKTKPRLPAILLKYRLKK
jgi:hypothetical protein